MTYKEAIERIEDMQRSMLFNDCEDDQAIEIALSALRDQEPRILTLSKEEDGIGEYPLMLYVELRMSPIYPDEVLELYPWKKAERQPFCYPDIMRTIADGECHCDGGNLKVDAYRKSYRFWTRRPTDAQMIKEDWL